MEGLSPTQGGPSSPYLHPYMARADQLLTDAGRIMSQMLEDCSTTVSAFTAVQLDRMAEAAAAGKPGEKLLSSLQRTTETEGSDRVWLRSQVGDAVRNTYDYHMERTSTDADVVKKQQRHHRARERRLSHLVDLYVRNRSKHAIPEGCLRMGLEYKYLGTPRHIWEIHRQLRIVPGHTWIDTALASPEARLWRPPGWEEGRYTDIEVAVRDNKEWYRRLKYTRHVNGVKVDSELVHTVTGENLYVRGTPELEKMPDPGLGDRWPFEDKYGWDKAIVNNDDMLVVLEPLWKKVGELVEGNPMQLLLRPPPEADHQDRQGPTVTWHPPIILNCGTSSTADNAKIVRHLRKHRGAARKTIVTGDMQTVTPQ